MTTIEYFYSLLDDNYRIPHSLLGDNYRILFSLFCNNYKISHSLLGDNYMATIELPDKIVLYNQNTSNDATYKI